MRVCRLPMLVIAALWCLAASAQPAPVGPEAFLGHPDYRGLRLSPSGKYIAVLVPVQGRVQLAIMTLDPVSVKVVGGMEGRDINTFAWVNDERIVFSLIDLQSGLGEQGGFELFAVDRDGKDFRELGARPPTAAGAASVARPRGIALLSVLHDGSDDVLVVTNELSERFPDVYRLNTRSNRRTLKSFDKPGDVVQWVPDRGGVLRAAVAYERGQRQVFWRAAEDSRWVQIGSFGLRGPRITPVTFDGDGSLIVAADTGRDTAALYRYDTGARALGELIAAHPTQDLRSGLVYDWQKKRIVGVRYDAERPGYAWFDDDWARLSKGVDNALPDHMNVLAKAGTHVLVFSYSDTDPGAYYTLDLASRKLEPLVAARRGIDPARMPHREALRYAARDGLSIPAFLTLPRDRPARALPLVVDVHGGPWVRGSGWGWNGEAAYLASLGYAVLQPEYRGSTGWGRKAFEASWKQWGRAMQDDLDDGVDALVKRGVADPARVCIMGASYGGYAVMMGLARNPERWKCGVDMVGVTDIDLMFDVTWSDSWDSEFMRYDAREMIGDQDKDAALLKQASPLQNAARIKAPVLMAYGGRDFRVPAIHGERMRDALREHGVPVEWVLYPDEGHGFLLETNRFDFYRRVARFLEANLGPAAAK